MRDALATAAGLLREACWLAAAKLGRADDVPARAGAVSPGWLTRALERDFPGVRVRSLNLLGSDAGTTDRARLRVVYDGAPDGGALPASVFIKVAPRDGPTRLFVNLMRLGTTEVRFYRELAPHLPIETPRAFHAASAGRAQRFVLVLDDLAAHGVRFTDVGQPTTIEEARLVVDALARLHARYWDRAPPRWLERRREGSRYRVERFLSAAGVAAAVRRCPDLVPATLRAAAPRLVAARDRFEEAWARPPLTVVHGDAHAGNLYFRADTVGFLDWQVVQRGQGMRDVAYFIITSLATELRRAGEHELMTRYLDRLAAEGAVRPDPDDASRQYRLHAAYAFIATAVTAAAARLQAAPIARAGLARASTAVEDLDPLAALGGG